MSEPVPLASWLDAAPLIDILLGTIVLAGMWGGWRRGWLAASAELIGLAASLLFALWAYPHGVALLASQGLDWGVWAPPLTFLAAFLLARLVLALLLGRLVAAVPAKAHASRLNRALGVIPGAGNGLVNALVVAMLLLALPLADGFSRKVADSVIVARLSQPAEWLEARLGPIFNPAFERTLSKLTVRPGSSESLSLPFTVAQAPPRPDLEARMLELVNEERARAGLRPLLADPEARDVARAHSQDMFARGYFSHVTPDGKDPFDRLRSAGVRYLNAGENLALARNLPMAHQGLMDSPGHRANILRPQFGRVGIGILDGGRYGLMVTQNFRN
ncbi:MAG TPA: CvpA family protein [Caldimonas sp.]|jgi:uncharacterized protein YkwD|nr:CvpA family protein [Caldimonas sp.]HEX2540149.1 CvpA family protein [Caldimonas sp.]